MPTRVWKLFAYDFESFRFFAVRLRDRNLGIQLARSFCERSGKLWNVSLKEEAQMTRHIAISLALIACASATAWAQEGKAGAARFEVSAIPGGGMFFTAAKDDSETDFGNYALGASAAYHVNRSFAVEGEIGSGIGVKQDLSFNGSTLTNRKSPNTLAYNANLVIAPRGSDHAAVPYVVGGIGGLTLFERNELASLGLTKNETYFTGNLGGGMKWYSGRYWGLRGDYRFFWINGKKDAPSFFGLSGDRFGHRVYGSILFTFGK